MVLTPSHLMQSGLARRSLTKVIFGKSFIVTLGNLGIVGFQDFAQLHISLRVFFVFGILLHLFSSF